MLARRAKPLALLATVLVVSWLAFRGATTAAGFPLLGVDGRVFLPQALTYAQSGELINHAWQPAASLDPTGNERMLYHGFLYPMVIGTLIGAPRSENLVLTLAAIQTLAALALPLLLLDLRRRRGIPITLGGWFWTLAFGVATSVYTYGSPGRAEPLVALLIMTAVVVGWRLPVPWRIRGTGILLGVVASLDPLVGLLAALITLPVCAWTMPPRGLVTAALVAGGYAMACFALLITCIYPYSWNDWVLGMLRMGGHALKDGRPSEAFAHWMTNGPNWMLPVAVMVIGAGAGWLARGRGPASPVAFAVLTVLALAAMVRFTIIQHWAVYNLAPFIPLGMIAPYLAVTAPRAALAFRLSIAACLSVIAIGVVRDLALRGFWLDDGISLRDAKARIARFSAAHPQARIAFTEPLYTLVDDVRKVDFFVDVPPPSATMIVLPQAYEKNATPPHVRGFSLLEDHFQQSTPVLFGVTLAADQKGCGFAIYQRNEPPRTPAQH
jgi:hypothetical protein